MGYNLVVFAWNEANDSAAKRKKGGVTFADVHRAICESGNHPALGEVSFREFEAAVASTLGKGPDAPYTLERYRCARVFRVALADEQRLVPRIGLLARKFGLTSAGE